MFHTTCSRTMCLIHFTPLVLKQGFLTCGKFPTCGESRDARWGMITSRRKQKTLKNSFLTWCMTAAKAVFAEKSLSAFWATMYGLYPRVAVAAFTLLVAFPSTYLCESAFSSMVQIKTKSRNRLIDIESDFCCAISKVEPNIEALIQAKQMQKSH